VNHSLKIDTSAQSFSKPFTENSTNPSGSELAECWTLRLQDISPTRHFAYDMDTSPIGRFAYWTVTNWQGSELARERKCSVQPCFIQLTVSDSI